MFLVVMCPPFANQTQRLSVGHWKKRCVRTSGGRITAPIWLVQAFQPTHSGIRRFQPLQTTKPLSASCEACKHEAPESELVEMREIHVWRRAPLCSAVKRLRSPPSDGGPRAEPANLQRTRRPARLLSGHCELPTVHRQKRPERQPQPFPRYPVPLDYRKLTEVESLVYGKICR